MRRKDRDVTDFGRILDVIEACDTQRLGRADGDFPYIVPVSFSYEVVEGELLLYFHGAMAGRKYELLTKNPLCSFEMDCDHRLECIPEKRDVTMRYRSVMGRGRVELLEGEEKQRAIDLTVNRYELSRGFDYSRAALPRTMVARVHVLELTAKVNAPGGGAD